MSGTEVVYAAGLFSCVLLFAALFGLAGLIVRELVRNGSTRWSRAGIIVFGILTLCLAVFLLRPHEHTFQGLDSSAYRLMAKSFLEGRPFKSVDETLQEVPADIRPWLLLLPSETGRITRDRSFEIESLDSCKTKPFFYPLLPLCMVGFDILVPGKAFDYMVPVVGLIFCVVCVGVGISRGEIPGALVAIVLLSGSPLPAWLFRGCFVESVAGILIAMSLLSWIIRGPDPDIVRTADYSCQSRLKAVLRAKISRNFMFVVPRLRGPASLYLQLFALGLAVSFHPVMVVLAVPIMGIMLLDIGDAVGKVLRYICAFIAGLLPIVALTLFVAAPYGQLNLTNLSRTITHSASIRPAMAITGLLGIVFAAALFGRRFVVDKIRLKGRGVYLVSALLLALWILPTFFAVRYWEYGQGGVVRRGLAELRDGLQIPFGIGLIFFCLYLLVSKQSVRSRIVVSASFVTLPLFLYLKGAEYMGLWSQRRLIASLLVVLVCCLPHAASLVKRMTKSGVFRIWRILAVVIVLGLMGFSNAARWPAPYVVCYEKGADMWVKAMLDRIGNKLTAVDYHPYSVPLITGGKSRIVGLSEFGYEGLPALSKWLAQRAREEEVLLLTAYNNPGLEQGVILESAGHETIRLDRVRSKTALPAVKYERVVDVEILRLRPVAESDSPSTHKVFDKGSLGLRGSWGRKDIAIKLPNGERLSACWSREGSGIIGPVPPPGGTVQIRLEAAAERQDGLNHQTIRFHPPWIGEALSLTVSNSFTSVSGKLSRPFNQTDDGKRTGVYRIHADAPYSPEKVGIKGFADDLGALIHLIRIEIASP